MEHEKCGIYEIISIGTGKRYVGSSMRIYRRWSEHRRQLRLSKHASPRLQRAWIKHGERNFVFRVIEECPRERLFEREQFHIDVLKPDYNSMPVVTVFTAEMKRKLKASQQARAALITHCPKGHEYTPENTALNQGKRICKACNRERVMAVYASETPEQREARRQRAAEYYQRTIDARRAKQAEYTANTKDQKRAYDEAHRAESTARRRARIQAETFEQRANRLQRKYESRRRLKAE